MRFPVFLLGLVFSSLALGGIFWLSGASVGKSLAWALGAFFLGQVLYVVLIGFLAKKEETVSGAPATDRKTPDPAVTVRRAQLAARSDQQG